MDSSRDLEHLAECMMVDTLGLKVEEIDAGKLPRSFARVSDELEEVERSTWSKGDLQAASGEKSLQVRGVKKKQQLLVEGSNAFHHQGHNIVSSSDVPMSAFSMLKAVKDQYQLDIPLNRALRFARGQDIHVTRIDTPLLLKLPDGVQKKALVNALALAGIVAGINVGLYCNESVYFDQHSQQVGTKMYDKLVQVSKKKRKLVLPESACDAELYRVLEDTLRMEPVYRLKYFNNHRGFKGRPVYPMLLTPHRLAAMFGEQMEKYNLKGKLRRYLMQEELWQLPPAFRPTVWCWQTGGDLRKLFEGNEAVLNRHRRFLKTQFSIDIFGPPPGDIEVPIEIGEILHIENFIPVPEIIRNDPQLFYQIDMEAAQRSLRQRVPRGIGSVYVDPYYIGEETGDENGEFVVL